MEAIIFAFGQARLGVNFREAKLRASAALQEPV